MAANQRHESSLETRGKIIALWDVGYTTHEIADEIDLSRRQIQRWISRYQNNNVEDRPLRNLPRTGRRPCLSQPQIAQIEQWVLANPFTTTQKIKEQFGLECSNVTIKRQLNKIGFRCRCPARKIELTNEHAENRVRFARARKIELTNEHAENRVRFARQNAGRDWQNVIFSDEKVFSTSDDSPKVLWRQEDVEKITRDVAKAGSSEVEKPVEVQSFTGEKKFVQNEDIANQPKQKISSQRKTSNNVEIQSTTMLAVAAKITETETCEDMNELSKVAKTAKIQNTRERRNAVCRDEARFEHKQTVLHEETNNIEEEYSVLQKQCAETKQDLNISKQFFTKKQIISKKNIQYCKKYTSIYRRTNSYLLVDLRNKPNV
ncbi:Transposase [Popillia japonica]|uniref:Transposase n=1 Tax=Popillia japonica TaxID=7064 RepID=A0AAW1IEQ2_POPJA